MSNLVIFSAFCLGVTVPSKQRSKFIVATRLIVVKSFIKMLLLLFLILFLYYFGFITMVIADNYFTTRKLRNSLLRFSD